MLKGFRSTVVCCLAAGSIATVAGCGNGTNSDTGYSPGGTVGSASTWSRVKIDSAPHAPVTSMSCPSTKFCLAVSAGGNVVSWNGSSWSSPVLIDSANRLEAVSCSSALSCEAVDARGNALAWNGRLWSGPKLIDPGRSVPDNPPLTRPGCSDLSLCATTTALNKTVRHPGRASRAIR